MIDVSSTSSTLLAVLAAVTVLVAGLGGPVLAAPLPTTDAASVTTTQAGDVDIRLVPTDGGAPGVNESVTYEIVADGVTDGMAAMRVTVETSDPDVLAVTNGSTQFVVPRENPSVEAPRSAEFLAFSEGDVPSTVTVGTVTVEGRAAGSAQLAFTHAQINTFPLNNTEQYRVTPRNLTVVVRSDGDGNLSIPPLVGDAPPTDPDGDGLYEDVNGNGEFTIIDVANLLTEYEGPIVEQYAAAFDFSNDGRISIIDVARLLNELVTAD